MQQSIGQHRPGKATWEPHPSDKVSSAHKIVGRLYLVPAVLIALALAFSGQVRSSMGLVYLLCALLLFSAIHFGLSYAADRKLRWSKVPSIVFALPLLLAVPIGTMFGVVLIVNASKTWE